MFCYGRVKLRWVVMGCGNLHTFLSPNPTVITEEEYTRERHEVFTRVFHRPPT